MIVSANFKESFSCSNDRTRLSRNKHFSSNSFIALSFLDIVDNNFSHLQEWKRSDSKPPPPLFRGQSKAHQIHIAETEYGSLTLPVIRVLLISFAMFAFSYQRQGRPAAFYLNSV